MCKSQADGGRRCNGHRRQAVHNSVATLAAATSPLSRTEVTRQVEDARAAGDMAPADREEIDVFLEEAAVRAETCDALTPRSRAAAVARLREAIGHLKVDRATLAAWQARLSRTWAQVRRGAAGALLAATIAAGVGGCGAGGDTHVPEPTASAPADAPEIQPFATAAIPKLDVPNDVAAFFGSDSKAQAAYQRVAKAYMIAQMDVETLSVDRVDATPADFAIRRALSPTARATFDTRVAAAAAGDQQAYQDVSALSLFDALDANSDTGTQFRTAVPSVTVQRRVEHPRIAMGSGGRPKLTIVYRGAMRITEHGDQFLSPYGVKTTLWLNKNGKIDAWASDWQAVDPGPQITDRW